MKYIVAVSGGIDSVALLHALTHRGDAANHELFGQAVDEFVQCQIIVAHVDHGIRADSADDELFVRKLASQYGLDYVSTRLELGANASESTAREARYAWLNGVKQTYVADAIVTAHHEDDVLETILINLERGTGWRGVCSLRDHGQMRRPLLSTSKATIIQYALRHDLQWHEDSTNDDYRYTRNMIRQTIMYGLLPQHRRELLRLYHAQVVLGGQVDNELELILPLVAGTQGLRRYWLIMVGSQVAGELISAWQQRRFTSRALQRLWLFACTAHVGKKTSQDGIEFVVTIDELIVSPPHI